MVVIITNQTFIGYHDHDEVDDDDDDDDDDLYQLNIYFCLIGITLPLHSR